MGHGNEAFAGPSVDEYDHITAYKVGIDVQTWSTDTMIKYYNNFDRTVIVLILSIYESIQCELELNLKKSLNSTLYFMFVFINDKLYL